MTLKGLVFVPFFAVSLAAPLAWAGAPPECETDEQCQDWGYESCGQMGCEGGEAMENHTEWEPPPAPNACASDADCPEGQRCETSGSFSGGGCIDSPASSEDTDTSDAGESGAEGAEEEVSSGCQGGQTSHGLVVLLAGLALLLTRRRGAMG